MMYRFSAVIGMIVAMCFSVMAWTPPNNDPVGIDTKGVIFAKAVKITELTPQVNPPGVMSQLMTNAKHQWITGLRMKRDGDYFIYETGSPVPLGKMVKFCFYLGVDFWVPDCYYESQYAHYGAAFISDWDVNAPSNWRGGHNFEYPAAQAR